MTVRNCSQAIMNSRVSSALIGASSVAQLEDSLGIPIVLLVAKDATTGAEIALRVRDLGPACIIQIVQWLNARLSTP